ncbi:MAG: electron transfer flavoprotein beta subunit [Chitinophagales bacterium]|jgi:electron transfer flavoprotein beta subunit
MKILVPISKVPDTTAKISFTNNNTEFDTNNVQFIINPTDEWFALVRGIELVEKNGGSVTVINVGPADNEQFIRKALAIGANDAVRVDAEPKDAFFTASQIADYAKANAYDLVLTGKETIDYNGAQIGGMIAEFMDAGYVSLVTRLDIEDGKVSINREIEGGEEVVEASLPLVISAQKGMAEQRIPNMRGIMQARTKPLTVIPANGNSPLVNIAAYHLPEEKDGCTYVDADNVGELVRLLHEEAKVI